MRDVPNRRRAVSNLIFGLLLSLVLVLSGSGYSDTEAPVVRMYLFHSPDCLECQAIIEEYLPTLTTKYRGKLIVEVLNIEEPQAHQLLLGLEVKHGIGSDRATVPEAFLGDIALIGAKEIRAALDRSIEGLLAIGGADYPEPAPKSTLSLPPILPTMTPIPEVSREGAVHVMLFFSPTCPHCETVREKIMPPLYEKYGGRLVVREFDVSEAYNFYLEIAIEQAAGMPAEQQGYIPFMVVGRHLLTNAGVIAEGLDGLIQEYLDQGGAPWPIDPRFFVSPEETPVAPEGPTAPAAAEQASTSTPFPIVHMAYFTRAGCQEYDRAQYEINYLTSRYDNLDVTVFDIAGYAALNEWLSDKYDVPEKYRLTAPAIFVGQSYLVDKDVSPTNIERLVQVYRNGGAEPTWNNWEAEAPEATSRIIERFRSFGILTVLLAGLIDGLNPCAFATIIFFVSYLAFTGRKGRDILLIGMSFALGVFITYLSVGLGLYQLLQRLPFLSTLGNWVYGITAALCLVLAGLSITDFFAARKGRPQEMRLRLPMRLRRWINTLIRDSANTPAFAAVAFATGFSISLIELACTGQVYLPTILFVMGIAEMRANAFPYLLLYNIMFITPLLIVFVLAYLGTSSEQMAGFVNRNTARIKLATAVLFLVLAGWLIFMLV